MPRLTNTLAWRQLVSARAKLQAPSSANATRPASAIGIIHAKALGITADFSRQMINADALAALNALASEIGLSAYAKDLVAGKAMNPTESRPVLHTLLRATSANQFDAEIARERIRIEQFSDAVRGGHSTARSIADNAFRDVVVVGIGGSFLGPALAVAALAQYQDGPTIHFVSNIDGAAMRDTLKPLNAATTLIVVISKTFSTEETNINAAVAREWLTGHLGADAFQQQFVAITANPIEAAKQGYQAERTFLFLEGVGGRYSMWSSVGLPIALAVGFKHFSQMLAGANAMDAHFASAPFSENIPMLAAAVTLWNRHFCGVNSHAVLPYAQRLDLLANHLQQLEMESNGKSVDVDGVALDYPTCPVIFGQAGTNGQHSFYQLLHQGTDIISSDIIILRERESNEFSFAQDQHDRLNTNALAQGEALWHGHTPTSGAPHKVHRGGRPVTLLEFLRLDAWHLGLLVALYEHKTAALGLMWHINSFDQWGVELGKVIARKLLPDVKAYPRQKSFLVSAAVKFRNTSVREI